MTYLVSVLVSSDIWVLKNKKKTMMLHLVYFSHKPPEQVTRISSKEIRNYHKLKPLKILQVLINIIL